MDFLTPLTCEALRSLTTLTSQTQHKSCLIQSYLQGQKVHAKAFAADGVASWNTQAVQEGSLGASLENAIGFGTPVLKARVAAPEADAPDSETLANACKDQRESPIDISVYCFSKSGENTQNGTVATAVRHKVSFEKGKAVTKKRTASVDDEQENADSMSISQQSHLIPDMTTSGLIERRERKRVKRAIVKPVELEIEREVSTLGDEDCNGRRKAKKQKMAKLPAAFALLHGFRAANVGKNRLTVCDS